MQSILCMSTLLNYSTHVTFIIVTIATATDSDTTGKPQFSWLLLISLTNGNVKFTHFSRLMATQQGSISCNSECCYYCNCLSSCCPANNNDEWWQQTNRSKTMLYKNSSSTASSVAGDVLLVTLLTVCSSLVSLVSTRLDDCSCWLSSVRLLSDAVLTLLFRGDIFTIRASNHAPISSSRASIMSPSCNKQQQLQL